MTGIIQSYISSVCRHERRCTNGFIFRFADPDAELNQLSLKELQAAKKRAEDQGKHTVLSATRDMYDSEEIEDEEEENEEAEKGEEEKDEIIELDEDEEEKKEDGKTEEAVEFSEEKRPSSPSSFFATSSSVISTKRQRPVLVFHFNKDPRYIAVSIKSTRPFSQVFASMARLRWQDVKGIEDFSNWRLRDTGQLLSTEDTCASLGIMACEEKDEANWTHIDVDMDAHEDKNEEP